MRAWNKRICVIGSEVKKNDKNLVNKNVDWKYPRSRIYENGHKKSGVCNQRTQMKKKQPMEWEQFAKTFALCPSKDRSTAEHIKFWR